MGRTAMHRRLIPNSPAKADTTLGPETWLFVVNGGRSIFVMGNISIKMV